MREFFPEFMPQFFRLVSGLNGMIIESCPLEKKGAPISSGRLGRPKLSERFYYPFLPVFLSSFLPFFFMPISFLG